MPDGVSFGRLPDGVVELRAEARAKEFGIDRVYDDPAELFADGGFELVDIAASGGAISQTTVSHHMCRTDSRAR